MTGSAEGDFRGTPYGTTAERSWSGNDRTEDWIDTGDESPLACRLIGMDG